MLIPLASAHLLTLPPALAASAGTDTVLAAEDEMGLVEAFGTWTATPEGYEVEERLRRFTVAEEAELVALFVAARGPAASPPPSGRRAKGQSKVVHSRPAHVRCRPGRAW